MKPINKKKCRNKGCNKIFTPFKTTDIYCSYACAAQNQKPKKPRPLIRKRSKKGQQLDRIYSKQKKNFMKLPENKTCPVAKYFLQKSDLSPEEQLDWARNLKATEIHHKAGRIGKLLNYVPYWLAVSRKGHEFIHNNPEFSYSKDWLIKSTTV